MSPTAWMPLSAWGGKVSTYQMFITQVKAHAAVYGYQRALPQIPEIPADSTTAVVYGSEERKSIRANELAMAYLTAALKLRGIIVMRCDQ